MAGKPLKTDLKATERAIRPRTQRALRTAVAQWADSDVNRSLNSLIAGEIDAQQFLTNVYSKIATVNPIGLQTDLARLHGKGVQEVYDWLTKAPEVEATRYANQYAGERINNIRRTSMSSIRQYVATATEVPGAMPGLRGNIANVLMMDDKWARAAASQFRQLEMQGVKESVKSMKARTNAYVQRVADQRAEMIARTEVINALNGGKALGFQVAKAAGLLDEDAEQVWITATGECSLCGQLNGVTVPVGQPWQVNGVEVYHPTLHPNCRCTIGIA